MTLTLFAILFNIWWQFRLVTKISDVENIVKNDEFFANTTYTPKEGIEQHRKQECLLVVVSKAKAYLLGSKKQWAHERVGKASRKTGSKVYAEYKQGELKEKGEKLEKL